MNVQNVGGYQTGIDYLPAAGKNIFERENVNFNVEETTAEKVNEGAIKTAEQKTQDLKDAYAVMTSGVNSTRTTNDNKTVQRRLTQLGFYSGSVDGNLYTDASKKALKNFQRVYGLAQTGQISNMVQDKLKAATSCYRAVASKSDLGTITSMVSGYSDFKESEIRDYFAKTWAFFRVGMGLTVRQASGVLGNIMAESGCVPDNAQDTGTNKKLHDKDYKFNVSDGRGYGLIQWTIKERKQLLKDTSSQMGLPVNDINAQFACFRKETERDDMTKSAWKTLKEHDMIDTSTGIFLSKIENPKVQNFDERYSKAKIIYSVMK